MKINKRVLALLLSVVLISAFFVGCEKRIEDPSSEKSNTEVSTSAIVDKTKTIASAIPDFKAQIVERKADNSDTVGWLEVPFTSVNDVVLWANNKQKNDYYLRLDFNKKPDFNGVFYADYRSPFGEGFDGSAASLPLNTVIYGHAMTDNPEKEEQYAVKFGPLHDLRNPDFATDVPYIFYSTEKENLAFEIFALLVVNSDNGDVPYNHPSNDPEEFFKTIQEEILPRSVLDYDVELNKDDKFITLSTCIYRLPGQEDQPEMKYPNSYRYAVMGRLVTDTSQPLKETVAVTVNEDILLDPNGPMTSAKK